MSGTALLQLLQGTYTEPQRVREEVDGLTLVRHCCTRCHCHLCCPHHPCVGIVGCYLVVGGCMLPLPFVGLDPWLDMSLLCYLVVGSRQACFHRPAAATCRELQQHTSKQISSKFDTGTWLYPESTNGSEPARAARCCHLSTQYSSCRSLPSPPASSSLFAAHFRTTVSQQLLPLIWSHCCCFSPTACSNPPVLLCFFHSSSTSIALDCSLKFCLILEGMLGVSFTGC